MPIIVRDVSDELTLQHALVENLHRDDLNPLEEAAAYQQLIEDFGMTQEAVAHRVGKSRSAVANLLRLFQLTPQVQRLVADGQVSAGHAKALLGTPDRSFQEALARRIVAEGLTVRDTEEAVRLRTAAPDSPAPDGGTPGSKLRAPGLLELEELLADQLDTRVKINMGPSGAGRDRVRRSRGPRAHLPRDVAGRVAGAGLIHSTIDGLDPQSPPPCGRRSPARRDRPHPAPRGPCPGQG